MGEFKKSDIYYVGLRCFCPNLGIQSPVLVVTSEQLPVTFEATSVLFQGFILKFLSDTSSFIFIN